MEIKQLERSFLPSIMPLSGWHIGMTVRGKEQSVELCHTESVQF
jgi:hypothetical protein